jgi:hypothetical protein
VEELYFSVIKCADRQIEVHAVEPLVPGPSRVEAEISIAKIKKYKSPGSD